MSSPSNSWGFTAEVNDLEHMANSLVEVADLLRAPVGVLTAHEGLDGPGFVQASRDMCTAYAHFTDSIGHRQKTGCDRIDDTARALREIASLYRRADGQG